MQTTSIIAPNLGEVRTLATFISAINGELTGHVNTLYRGQRDAAWSLRLAIDRQARRPPGHEEKSMLEEFKRRAIPYLDSPASDLTDTHWLAIAQHHGMPTRMLDWSGSALTALWFAIRQQPRQQKAAAVWLLTYEPKYLISDAEREKPLEVGRTTLLRPRHIPRRITAQDGWFTLHRGHYGSRRSPAFVSLETNTDYEGRLCYVTVPRTAFGEMRVQLA
ncbi:FRG domain-containing protein [Paraburkholderia sp. MMS20-SJTR3]|uniref:FRG domain-containing protein n=1 Tax=Paraburkholderia sejongensis TaxID=2886946 RepID=A0ABS8K730_9BURK|nr:FRG domain-containing protein [Paraburkholderia sp. MMS20-SJTR3]MCC8397678.1 FRG domain-containing protein [Paraburkholderia sp. MMS20-SJTR3]